MHCPLCGFPIEDARRTTCPRCLAELPTRAASEAPPTVASPVVPPLPSQSLPPPLPHAMPPAAFVPTPPPAANPRLKFWVIGTLLVVLAIFALIGGSLVATLGKYQKQQAAKQEQLRHDLSTPESAAEAILQAFRKHDFERVYYVSEFKDVKRKSASEAKGFALGSTLSLIGKDGDEYRKFIAYITATKIGKPDYDGNHADVPVTLTYTFEGEKYPVEGVAHLIQRDGFWRFDLTEMGLLTDTPQDEAAFDQAFSDLLGLDDPLFEDEEEDSTGDNTEEKP
jgi:hypothetical protein